MASTGASASPSPGAAAGRRIWKITAWIVFAIMGVPLLLFVVLTALYGYQIWKVRELARTFHAQLQPAMAIADVPIGLEHRPLVEFGDAQQQRRCGFFDARGEPVRGGVVRDELDVASEELTRADFGPFVLRRWDRLQDCNLMLVSFGVGLDSLRTLVVYGADGRIRSVGALEHHED